MQHRWAHRVSFWGHPASPGGRMCTTAGRRPMRWDESEAKQVARHTDDSIGAFCHTSGPSKTHLAERRPKWPQETVFEQNFCLWDSRAQSLEAAARVFNRQTHPPHLLAVSYKSRREIFQPSGEWQHLSLIWWLPRTLVTLSSCSCWSSFSEDRPSRVSPGNGHGCSLFLGHAGFTPVQQMRHFHALPAGVCFNWLPWGTPGRASRRPDGGPFPFCVGSESPGAAEVTGALVILEEPMALRRLRARRGGCERVLLRSRWIAWRGMEERDQRILKRKELGTEGNTKGAPQW